MRVSINGELRGFTGVDAPYEVPDAPELVIDTASEYPEESVERLVEYIQQHHPRKL